MDNKIIIAVDGHSSCGKSTLAKALALKLGYNYIDTGAMYRAVTLKFIRKNISISNKEAILKLIENTDIECKNIKGENRVFLDDNDVEHLIRSPEVADMVSPVSEISMVRRYLVTMQKKMGLKKALVMDGRDIGTVVFPNAALKLFITADLNTRALRRFKELQYKGEIIDFEDVKSNLAKRDYIDSNREDSPLKQADDAILIDTSKLNREEQLQKALEYATKKIESL